MLNLTSRTQKLFVAAAAALTLSGTVLTTSSPAAAGTVVVRTGIHHVGGYHGYPAYRPLCSNRAAIAAGVLGGLALGTIAARSFHHAPVYVAQPVRWARDCFVERRIRINRFGERVVREVRICD